MRPIDTKALDAVARSLGVGAPISAVQPVDFDDGVLVQCLDVSSILQVPSLYTWWEIQLGGLADSVTRTTLTVAGILGVGVAAPDYESRLNELGLAGLDRADVYLMGVPQCMVSAAEQANLDEAMCGLELLSPLYADSAATPAPVYLQRGNSATNTNPLLSTADWLVLDQSIQETEIPGYPGPWWLPNSQVGQSNIAFLLDTDAAGVCTVLWKFPVLIIRRGLPLPSFRGAWNAL